LSPFQVLTPFSAERPTIYANGFTMWHYKSTDRVSAALSDGYFDMASDMLRSGDFIFANLEIDGLSQSDLLVVSGNNEGVVRVSKPGLPPRHHPETEIQTATAPV